MSDAISMKVPTKVKKEKVICGAVVTTGGAKIEIVEIDRLDKSVRVKVADDLCGEPEGWWMWAEDARQAAQFFTNLARVLEGKPQE